MARHVSLQPPECKQAQSTAEEALLQLSTTLSSCSATSSDSFTVLPIIWHDHMVLTTWF
jgi:hypothetical protein